jgi:catechol 2,3-dioxygenase-like lactoylglutathione lyase family enzyme
MAGGKAGPEDGPVTRGPGSEGAHLRIARPTNDLEAVVRFYRDGLGFEVLAGFKDHAGFDGVMMGVAGAPYHLEFTHRAGGRLQEAPASEHLLVFYLPDKDAWKRAVDRFIGAGHAPIRAENPYWNKDGATFEDPDGYRVVIQNAAWPA